MVVSNANLLRSEFRFVKKAYVCDKLPIFPNRITRQKILFVKIKNKSKLKIKKDVIGIIKNVYFQLSLV